MNKRTEKQIKTSFKKRIQNYILYNINTKQWPQNYCIPSEHWMAEHFECSRLTARNAMQSLVLTGILQSIKGKGYIVVQKTSKSMFKNTNDDFQIDETSVERDEQLKLTFKQAWVKELFEDTNVNLNYTFGFKKVFKKIDHVNNLDEIIVYQISLLNRDVIFHFDKEQIEKSPINFLLENNVSIDASTEIIIFDKHYIFDEFAKTLGWKTTETYPIILSIISSNKVWVEISAKVLNKNHFRFVRTQFINQILKN